MQWFINLSLEMRYAILFVMGLIAGGFANYLIYSWAYFPRNISPWAPPHQESPPRRAADRLPVLGWFGLRRESPLHGRAFWFRPLLIELSLGVALPAMYWFYTQTAALLPEVMRDPAVIAGFSPWAHSLFLVHAVLLVLMVAATFIDFDEQTIPDVITLPGTLLALIAAMLPWRTWLPSTVFWGNQLGIAETTFNVPWEFGDVWLGSRGLVTALTIWTVWCFALTDRHIVLRRGLARALGYLCHGVRRNPTSRWLGLMWIVGTVVMVTLWIVSGEPFRGLLSGLIGLAVGGGVVWAVRIVAGLALRQEAMGFGDVTLMAMIGAVVGWQCAIVSFFLAPMVAILVVLVQFAVTRQPAVPFGPYLCGGTVVSVLGWDLVWNQTFAKYVLLGEILLGIMLTALVAMGVMLAIWLPIKRRLFGLG
jgi:leader peptidase (prepilin peptidase) / N-methyltransferase